MKHSNLMAFGLIALSFGLSAWYYGDLPDPMPTHFGLDGTPDRYTPLPWGAVLLPLIALGVYALMKLLPRISPREFSMDRFVGAYEKVVVAVVGLLTVVQWVLLQTATGANLNLMSWIGVPVGALLIVIANYMTKTEPNFFFGIRTPWTLANDEVWFRTHRQGAYLMALAGVIMILGTPFTIGFYISIAFVIGIAIWLVVYSYVLYTKITSREQSGRRSDP